MTNTLVTPPTSVVAKWTTAAGQIQINWIPSTDTRATGYVVNGSSDGGVTYHQIGKVVEGRLTASTLILGLDQTKEWKIGLRSLQGGTRSTVASVAAVKEPPKEEEPPPPPTEGEVTFYGSFETGKIEPNLYPYTAFEPGHVKVVPDPLGSGQKVLEFAINDSDLHTYSGSPNPRGDVETAKKWKPGDDVFIAIRPLVPLAVPAASKGWLQIAEVYGPPYGGSPTIGIDLAYSGGNRFCLARDSSHGYDEPWVGPLLDGKWHTIVLHVKFALDNTGFVELWYDGVQQKFNNGATKLNYATLRSGLNWDGNTGNFLDINQYRQHEKYPGTVVTYHKPPTFGTSFAAVQAKV